MRLYGGHKQNTSHIVPYTMAEMYDGTHGILFEENNYEVQLCVRVV